MGRVPGKTPSYISGDFEWLDDAISVEPTYVILQDMESNAVYQSTEGSRQGTFSHLGVGSFDFCLSNGSLSDDSINGADGKTRRVGFNLRVRSQAENGWGRKCG